MNSEKQNNKPNIDTPTSSSGVAGPLIFMIIVMIIMAVMSHYLG